jgi:hypothetical protein
MMYSVVIEDANPMMIFSITENPRCEPIMTDSDIFAKKKSILSLAFWYVTAIIRTPSYLFNYV